MARFCIMMGVLPFFFGPGVRVAWGQCENGKITPSDGLNGDQFGNAVDLDGNWLIVGASARDAGVGAAYLFERTGVIWAPQSLLLPPNPSGGDDFGRSVSIAEPFAGVGVPKADRGPAMDSGQVFMYRRSGAVWANEVLSAPVAATAFSEFGAAVSVYGDGVLIGAPFTDGVNTPAGSGNSGSAYVYRRDNISGSWMEEAALTASDAAELDAFGTAVKLHGNWAFVAAPADKDPNFSTSLTIGSVYVFQKQGANWLQLQKLVASDALTQTANRRFGTALDTDGIVLMVGERSGQSAYVFRLVGATWVEEAILKKPAAHAAGNDQFAAAVAIEGDLALVGAPTDDDNGLTNSGTLFAYRRIGGAWTEQPLIYATDATANNRLGTSLAMDGTTAASGALQPTVGAGAVYAYATSVRSDCDENGIEDSCELRLDPSLDSNANGTFDACECEFDTECVDGMACTLDSCDQLSGTCVYSPMPAFCLIDGVCYSEGAINPTNDCEQCGSFVSSISWTPRSNFTFCQERSGECRGTGTCQAGMCITNSFPTGAPCGDSSFGECDAPDTCSNTGSCLTNSVAYGTICAGNGVFCDGVQTCVSGVCMGPVVVPCAGTPSTPYCDETYRGCYECLPGMHSQCDDGNVCTNDWCSAAVTCGPTGCEVDYRVCVHTPVATLTPCGDQGARECDGPDICKNGFCNSNFLPNGAACSGNGIFCDGVQACQNGNCTGPVVDPCVGTPTRPFCTESHQACVECLVDLDCDDERPCTADACGPSGFCTHADLPVGVLCGPSVVDDCGLRGRCNTFGICINSIAPDGSSCIDDGAPCTLDYCEDEVCVHRMEQLPYPCGVNDCNCNAIPDECEVFSGALADCDGNDIPDECELPFFFATSARLSPIGYGHIQRFTIPHPPDAVSQAVFTVHAQSDLFASNEWIELYLNGSRVAQLFTTGGNDCPAAPDVRSALLDASQFNALIAGGDANLLLLPSSAVNADLCGPGSYVRVELRYEPADPQDCNINLIPDDCELADGSEVDIDPVDGRLDSCVHPNCLQQQTPSTFSCRIEADLGASGPASPSALVQLEMDSNCPAADLRPEHFDVVDTRPTETQAYIVSVTVNGSTVTVQLSQLPRHFGWTCVSLRGSGKSACVGLFPADVNRDQIANYLDVEAMISCCLQSNCGKNAPSTCDMNDSDVTDAEDLIVLLDFLNGTENFDMNWRQFHFLGSCPYLCGGPENVNCPYSSYSCRAEPAACTVQDKPIGTCLNPPYYCPPIVAPVCGCDGGTYANECEANRARVSISHVGACQP